MKRARLAVLAILIMSIAAGCGEEIITSPSTSTDSENDNDCWTVEGQIEVVFEEKTSTETIRQYFDDLRLDFTEFGILDRYIVWAKVVGGDPIELAHRLMAHPDIGVVVVDRVDGGTGTELGAVFVDVPLETAIEIVEGIEGLEVDRVHEFEKQTSVFVPAGEEKEWIKKFLREDFIVTAEQAIGCPI
jgi:hypothetical protein